MKLSARGRYAVMAMADLAQATAALENATPVPIGEIAQRQDIPQPYLEQLFAKLRKAGLVVSHRGAYGGYALAHPAHEMKVADVILAVDEPIKTTRCSDTSTGGCMSDQGRCLTHDLWDELSRQIYTFLASVTLEDVIEKRLAGRGFLSVDEWEAAQ
ncbi:MAG: Rrf2 family transcriptional regulator [Alphaproteobacteria bacterium]